MSDNKKIPVIADPMNRKNKRLVSKWVTTSDLRHIVETGAPGDLIEFDRGGYEHWGVYAGQCESSDGQDEPYVVHLGMETHSSIEDEDQQHQMTKPTVCKTSLKEVAGKSRLRINNYSDKEYKLVKDIDSLNKRIALFAQENQPYDVVDRNCECFAKYCRYESKVDVSRLTEQGSSLLLVMIFLSLVYIYTDEIYTMTFLQGLMTIAFKGAMAVVLLFLIILLENNLRAVFIRWRCVGLVGFMAQACVGAILTVVPVTTYFCLISIIGLDNVTLLVSWLKIGFYLLVLLVFACHNMCVLLVVACCGILSLYGPPYVCCGIELPGFVYVIALGLIMPFRDLKSEDTDMENIFFLLLGYIFSVPGLTYFVSMRGLPSLLKVWSK